MATYDQAASWSSQSLALKGTTSGRELLVFKDDNVSLPPLMGRATFDLVAAGTIGVCGGVINPTTETLWVEKSVFNVDTPSSAANALSLSIVATYTSGTGNIANATVGSDTGGLVTLRSSALLPVAWATGSYAVAYQALASTTLVGDISMFYVSAVTT